MHASPLSQDTQTGVDVEGNDPHVSAQVRSHFSITSTLGWNVSVYYAGRLISLSVPSYTRLEVCPGTPVNDGR